MASYGLQQSTHIVLYVCTVQLQLQTVGLANPSRAVASVRVVTATRCPFIDDIISIHTAHQHKQIAAATMIPIYIYILVLVLVLVCLVTVQPFSNAYALQPYYDAELHITDLSVRTTRSKSGPGYSVALERYSRQCLQGHREGNYCISRITIRTEGFCLSSHCSRDLQHTG